MNSAGNSGGAIHCQDSASSPTIVNNWICNNYTDNGTCGLKMRSNKSKNGATLISATILLITIPVLQEGLLIAYIMVRAIIKIILL